MYTRVLQLLFVALLPVSIYTFRVKRLEDVENQSSNSEEKPVVEFFDESSSEDQFSLQSTTTTESTTTIETYRKLTFSVSNGNFSKDFRPSVHLGEIKESRISGSPFNTVHHIKLENVADSTTPYHQLNNIGVVYQPEQFGHSIRYDHQGSYLGTVEKVPRPLDGNRKGETERNIYVKFQDQATDISGDNYGELLKDQAYNHQFANSVTENIGAQYNLVDQQNIQNLEKPIYEEIGKKYKQFFGKPSKFQGDTKKQELESLSNVEPVRNQYYVGFYDQDHQQELQGFDAKPHDGAVYVQEASFTRTKKFPYPFHQPAVGYHQLELVNDQQSSYPVRRRVSPWKKILHLIGAFLPIGLLVAALTPNIIKVNNATEPNVVLSKWRVADLPVEHKQARLSDSSGVCEDRLICDVILAGGEAGSNAIQNILWNLATRTSAAIAKESGLEEIFQAVKKKDCTTIIC